MTPPPLGSTMSDAGELSATAAVVLSAAAATLSRTLTVDDVDAPLSLLGADSLAIIELTAAVEAAIDIEIPPEIAHESATIRGLADCIDRRRRSGVCQAVMPDPFEQMLEDSVLPGDVRPGAGMCGTGLLDSRAVLITGATGFLGARLAADLLARSSARLYCIARGGHEDAEERLRRRLIENGASPDAIAGRVQLLDGDLTSPRLGLPAAMWRDLGATIDRVLHVGASVNWVASYAALRASNVQGTLELLRLASRPTPVAFHFVSSLSVCYAVGGPPLVDEAFDPLPWLHRVHLGYAQTKIVAEALVREAGRRGLPVKIYRPSLISGDSRTGAFNPDDLLSLLVRGCVRMGAAPDLDWALDIEPVDVVSAGILALSEAADVTTHLAHRRPRTWRECLLWMRLTGYDLQLIPYADWLTHFDRETARSPDHPLRPLRAFFLQRLPTAGDLTLPELYETTRRSRATAARTNATLAESIDRPPLDASLLDCYFSAYRAAGWLPAPAVEVDGPQVAASAAPKFDTAFFEAALSWRGQMVRVRSAKCISSGSDSSIISELTAWRSRQPAGLFRYSLDVERGRDRRVLNVVLKLKLHADDVTAVGEAVARLCDPRVGDQYARWRHQLGLAGTHLRERAIYESGDRRLTRYMPALLGVCDLDSRGGCALVLEDISDAYLLDSVDRTPRWHPHDIDTAIWGLAGVHGTTCGHTAPLEDLPWIGFRQSAATMCEMSDLWTALAVHAEPAFAAWGGSGLPLLHRHLIESIGTWSVLADEGPQALIHNDFNPRNLCFRERAGSRTLCAYDWELATLGAPQRDLAELLCFVLPAHVPDHTIDRWIERHRVALQHAAGIAIDRAQWQHGFAAAMNALLINRLAIYALVHRIRPQSFLPRVVATWVRIHERTVRLVPR